jgi:FAD synthase
MKLLSNLPQESVALTIGMFDGVHLGHQQILRTLRATGQTTAVLTFDPHPLELLRPPAPRQITPLPLKERLLEEFGVDLLITLPFTREFANTPFDALLEAIPLTHLILGEGAVFGKGRQGTEANVRAWARGKPVVIDYLPKLIVDGEPVSSSRIRAALEAGDRNTAERLLGWRASCKTPISAQIRAFDANSVSPQIVYGQSDMPICDERVLTPKSSNLCKKASFATDSELKGFL